MNMESVTYSSVHHGGFLSERRLLRRPVTTMRHTLRENNGCSPSSHGGRGEGAAPIAFLGHQLLAFLGYSYHRDSLGPSGGGGAISAPTHAAQCQHLKERKEDNVEQSGQQQFNF